MWKRRAWWVSVSVNSMLPRQQCSFSHQKWEINCPVCVCLSQCLCLGHTVCFYSKMCTFSTLTWQQRWYQESKLLLQGHRDGRNLVLTNFWCSTVQWTNLFTPSSHDLTEPSRKHGHNFNPQVCMSFSMWKQSHTIQRYGVPLLWEN